MVKAKKYWIPIIGILLFLVGCKPEEPTPIAPELEFTVVTLENEPVPNSRVFIFRNQQNFNLFLNDPSNETVVERKSFTNVSGIVTFTNLEEIEYFIYVEADGPNGSTLINTDLFRLGAPLEPNTTTNLKVTLEISLIPKIKIFSLDEEINNNPLSIWVGNIEGVPEAEYSIDSPGEDGQIIPIITNDEPTVNLYIRNEQGCVWQREITTTIGDTINVELSPCMTKKIVFYSSELRGKTFDVFLNDSEFIGQISNTRTTVDCGVSSIENETIVIYRPEGKTYNFLAQSVDGTCVQVGKVSTSNSCQDVVDLISECAE